MSDKIKKRCLQFTGHCLRSSWQVVSDLVLWKPTYGKSAGRPIKTYVDLLRQDTGQTPAEIKTCTENRRVWRAIIEVQQMSTEWVRVIVNENPHFTLFGSDFTIFYLLRVPCPVESCTKTLVLPAWKANSWKCYKTDSVVCPANSKLIVLP